METSKKDNIVLTNNIKNLNIENNKIRLKLEYQSFNLKNENIFLKKEAYSNK